MGVSYGVCRSIGSSESAANHALNQYFEDFYREFDDATVALIGNRYNLVGYDSEEEDYFSLTSYEEGLAQTEAGKRLCRLTKMEMLSRIGWAFGIMLAFFDLRQKYDYLKATFDILRDENTSLLGIIKDIEIAYDEMDADDFREWADNTKHFDRLLAALPDRAWLE